MRARTRLLALAICGGLLLPLAACTLSPGSVERARQNERLGQVLGLDANGSARFRGTVRSWSETADGAPWSGELVLALPAHIEGGAADVLVAAKVDTRTKLADASGASGSEALSSYIKRLQEQGRVLEVAVRKQGSSLRAVSVGSAGDIGREPPSLEGVLQLDAGGRGTYRGRLAKLVSSVSSGLIVIEPRYRTQGIEVTVSVPLDWDERTAFVPLSGARTSLPAALRSGVRPRELVEIGFRRGPDRLIAETVTER